MSEKKATVIVPTTGNRGPLLPYSVGSILNQTVQNIEIFIIGDGVDYQTRDTIYKLIEKDNRMRFFDHPKDVSRGEIYRHQALQEATGKIVCYLLDRDLMLPFHIENSLKYLEKYNFVSSLHYKIKKNSADSLMYYSGEPSGKFKDKVKSLQNVNNQELAKKTINVDSEAREKINLIFGGYMSTVSHTLDFYSKLPYGWRTTPFCYYTDQFMQLQMFLHKDCNPYFGISPPSILYFKRGNHPGWPVEKRLELLKYWYDLIQNGHYQDKINRLMLKGHIIQFGKKFKKKNIRRLNNIKKRIYEIFK